MATVHLLCGYMGFGKSTIARRLAAQYGAVILNDDEFIRELFGRDLPEPEFSAAHDKVTAIFAIRSNSTKSNVIWKRRNSAF